MCLCIGSTLVWVHAIKGVLATKADTESPAGGGGAFWIGDLHQVYMAVGRNKVHAAQWVRANASLSEGGPHLISQLLGELGRNNTRKEKDIHLFSPELLYEPFVGSGPNRVMDDDDMQTHYSLDCI